MYPAMYSRGGKVAKFRSMEEHFPSELHFSGEGDLFPISIAYEDDEPFAKGGLADEASKVRGAGRHGDSEVVHINKEELDELIQMWGPPTINPQTGMPEFFLKKLWKGVKKIVKPLAPILPIATMFIPGVGPLVSAGIGALAGGVTGGWKGALMGGAMGGLGASGAAGKLGAGVLGQGASAAAQNAVGQGLISGALGAASGQNPLTSAAMGAMQGYAAGSVRPNFASSATEAPLSTTQGSPLTASNSAIDLGNGISVPASTTSLAAAPSPVTGTTSVPGNNTSWFDREGLGIKGLTNKEALTLGLMAAGAVGGAKKSKSPTAESALADYQNSDYFKSPLSGMKGIVPIPRINQPQRSRAEQLAAGYSAETPYLDYSAFARGGEAAHPLSAKRYTAVEGPGTGRSDDIPAVLSDGEYVMDAETVALLGDGSSKAGAKKLDQFRVNIRKHKGRNLARGKFSVNAKNPERYMAGGRI